MPYVSNTPIGTANLPLLTTYTKTYPAGGLFTLCVTNNGLVSKKVVILEQGLVLGTIHTFGSSKNKCFANVQAGNIVSYEQQDGTFISNAVMPAADVNDTIP